MSTFNLQNAFATTTTNILRASQRRVIEEIMSNGALFSEIPRTVREPLVDVVNKVGPLRRFIGKQTINYYAYAVPPRPRAASMAAEYVTWRGLTDRRFSGRHLPAAGAASGPLEPEMDEVLALFRRDRFKPATDTSLLFPFFAQWFVDSFLRTKWEDPMQPRQFRENESNHEIDLCSIYGLTEAQTNLLREKSEDQPGRLRTQIIDGQEYPTHLFVEQDGQFELDPDYKDLYSAANFERVYLNPANPWRNEQKKHAFAVGLEHGSSTLGNSLMNTLFMREHNRVAGIIAEAHTDWDDERVFQTTRNVVIVELLNIVISDYIVHIAPIDFQLEALPGIAEREHWYRTNWMTIEFALLYRWHDLIPDDWYATLQGDRKSFVGPDLQRANALLKQAGLDQLLLDASRQHAGRIGLGNTADFLLHVKSLSVDMARGCRLQGYNAYRKHYGLKPITTFQELTGEAVLAGKLQRLYGDTDRLEWFVGLFAEGYDELSMMGELMVMMVANDAFTQALTNPLLAKAVYNEDTFSKEGMDIIQSNRTLADLIVCNTGLHDKEAIGFAVRSGGDIN